MNIFITWMNVLSRRTRPCNSEGSHLQLLLAVEVVEQMMKVELRHLSEQRQKTGDVLPLDERKPDASETLIDWLYLFFIAPKRLVERRRTVISAVHWGQRCPRDVSTE